MKSLMPLALLTAATLLPFSALAADLPEPLLLDDGVAQEDEEGDEEEDVLQEILSEGKTASAEDERRAVREGDIDDRVGVTSEALLAPGEDSRDKKVIKILQQKSFMKIGRYELAPHAGFVTNDPFIQRYMVGASFGYHLTELFAIEARFTFSPDFGNADWKPITHQLVEENKVSPDISKIVYFGNINLQYTPMYGKIAVLGNKIINFDIFGTFGTGFVHTADDLEALQAEDEPGAQVTEVQNHPTTNIGGGFRVNFSKNFAARLEGRSMIYIETINSTTLEMKNNFMLMGSVSFFFPGMD